MVGNLTENGPILAKGFDVKVSSKLRDQQSRHEHPNAHARDTFRSRGIEKLELRSDDAGRNDEEDGQAGLESPQKGLS